MIVDALAPGRGGAYFAVVVMKNLVRILTLLALLIAPAGMLGGHAAMATAPSVDASAGSAHCADMAGSHDQSPDEQAPAKSLECMMDCMMLCSAMPSMTAQLAEPLSPSPMAAAASLSLLVQGLTPQAEPRPPQFS